MIPVFEGGEGRRMRRIRPGTGGDRAINVAYDIAERVGPPFLMSAGQVRVCARTRGEQRRILRQHGVGGVAAADPQLVLPLLFPADRCLAAVDLEPQSVLVPGTHL